MRSGLAEVRRLPTATESFRNIWEWGMLHHYLLLVTASEGALFDRRREDTGWLLELGLKMSATDIL